MISIDLYSDFALDREQHDVVSAFISGNNVLVEAPPGTGKTYLGVVLGVTCLRESLLPPHGKVLFLTFSKNARVQIERQVDSLTSDGKVETAERTSLEISNYHAFFFDCLQHRKGLWGVRGSLRVGSLRGRSEKIKRLMKERNLNRSRHWNHEHLTHAFALERFRPDEILGPSADECPSHLTAAASEVARESLRMGLLHYDDFAPLMLDMLESCSSFVKYLRSKYPVVVLDEFQDTDRLQWEILKIWRPSRLAILYDRFQMIYEWRGSSVARIEGLKSEWGPFQEYSLRTIHRTEKRGRGLARFLMALREDNLSGGRTKTLAGNDLYQWLEVVEMGAQGVKVPPANRACPWVANVLSKSLREKKLAAVITRGNYLSRKLHGILSMKGKSKPRPFFSCRRIASDDSNEELLKDWIEELRGALPGLGLASWFAAGIDALLGTKARVPFRRPGRSQSAGWARLTEKAFKDSSLRLTDLLGLSQKEKPCWEKVGQLISSITERVRQGNLKELAVCLEAVIETAVTLATQYDFRLDPDAVFLFKAMARAARRPPVPVDNGEVADRLEAALLQASFLAARRPSIAPVFLSAHQSKGREFDHVIIPWLANVPEEATKGYEGRNQFARATGDPRRDAEELRLLYVALSRARERITILFPEESPSALLEQWGLDRAVLKASKRRARRSEPSQTVGL